MPAHVRRDLPRIMAETPNSVILELDLATLNALCRLLELVVEMTREEDWNGE